MDTIITVWMLVTNLVTVAVPSETSSAPPLRQSVIKGFSTEADCMRAGQGWVTNKVGYPDVQAAWFDCKEVRK